MDLRSGSLERGCVVDLRELKALEIAARSKITFDGTHWLVPSQAGTGKYQVTITGAPSCTCDDFTLHQQPCKHILAARLVCARDYDGKQPAIETEEIPKRKTYKQDWPRYNQAQLMEKHRLQVLLHDLCQTIPEPNWKPGRVPTPIADRLFSVVYKVYSTFSSRRFNCDLQDAYENGYLSKSLHPNKVNTFLEEATLTGPLYTLIARSCLPLAAIEVDFAVDSSGFSTSRFVRWYDEKYGVERSGKDWVKAHLMCGVKTNIVTAIAIEDKNAADAPQFVGLVKATAARGFTIREVSADKAYISGENLDTVVDLGGTPFIPFKVNATGALGGLFGKFFQFFQYHREEFLSHYHKRSNVESTFSMVKAKFRDHVRSRTDTAMKNEVLCKILCHNICCVIQAQCELGLEAEFWPEEKRDEPQDILPLKRPS